MWSIVSLVGPHFPTVIDPDSFEQTMGLKDHNLVGVLGNKWVEEMAVRDS